ncbi:MAG TPA: diguanylate cyclase, partial [Actinomycetota bacterium]|nr:diguanylate cyclase [Actinomycetota bacterium]
PGGDTAAPQRTSGPAPEPGGLALDDGLTGLRTRPAFLALGEQVLAVAARLGRTVTLLSLCLDNMKTIGDTFGHEEADRALGEVGALLSSTFRESDVLGRVGGDEFCVLLVDEAGPDGGGTVAQLRESLEAVNARSGRLYNLVLSMGMASLEAGGPRTLEDLLARAHRSMHVQKLAQQARPHLLVVEDDPGGQYLVQAIFADRCKLTFASRGEEALELARAAPPDLVLLDAGLAGVGGLDVVRTLRSSPETERIPIVLAAGEEPSPGLGSLRAAVDGFLVKPYDVAVLQLLVENVLRRSGKTR